MSAHSWQTEPAATFDGTDIPPVVTPYPAPARILIWLAVAIVPWSLLAGLAWLLLR